MGLQNLPVPQHRTEPLNVEIIKTQKNDCYELEDKHKIYEKKHVEVYKVPQEILSYPLNWFTFVTLQS